MSDKQDHREDLFEEDTPQGSDWENPFGVDSDPGPDGYWEEGFGEEMSGGLGTEEMGDTFPIDEAFFASDGEYRRVSIDTSAIPEGVRDLSAYTAGGTPIESYEEDDYDEYDDLEEEDYDDRNDRAIRVVRRRRTGCLGGLMYAAFILGVSTILAFVGWMVVDDVLGLTKEDIPVEITVPENFTLEEVAAELHAQGLINFPSLFVQYGRMFGAEDRIQPGVYQVRPVDFRAIIGSMNQRTGEMVEVRVMIPEGRTVRQIFETLEEMGVATAASLEYAAINGNFDFDFLNEVPGDAMNRLEGYLFPDTYIFFRRQNPEAVIRRMLSNFDVRMRQNDVYELVEASPFTLHEIVNIAAMIERETASVAEMPRISSVIWNRLNQNMHLGIDATIQYLLPAPMEFLTTAVIEEHWDSPYNTYAIIGLPYGPIANPGMAAILAALQPENTSFLFYALHIDGDRHHFTHTYAEHIAFINSPDFAHFGVFG